MSVTDRYTQSQTRLANSATELDVATALWRRGAADAHLAACSVHVPGSGYGVARANYPQHLIMNLRRNWPIMIRRRRALLPPFAEKKKKAIGFPFRYNIDSASRFAKKLGMHMHMA